MKIAVNKITNKGLELKEDILASSLEMDSEDIKFLDSIHIEGRCISFNQEIIVEVKITTCRDIICSRCLSSVRQSLKQDFKRSYSRNKVGEYLDIEQDIREEILLDFPMKVLCRPDCRGICAGCGVNLNFEECKCPKNKIRNPKSKIQNNIE